MRKLKEYWVIILLISLMSGGLFYWLEWRPAKIRIDCASKMHKATPSELGADKINGTFDEMLTLCLFKAGINK